MRLIFSMMSLCVVLLAVCFSGSVIAIQEAFGNVLETATGPDGLIDRERKGKVTVRRIRGLGALA